MVLLAAKTDNSVLHGLFVSGSMRKSVQHLHLYTSSETLEQDVYENYFTHFLPLKTLKIFSSNLCSNNRIQAVTDMAKVC